jgi:hypothetical protein
MFAKRYLSSAIGAISFLSILQLSLSSPLLATEVDPNRPRSDSSEIECKSTGRFEACQNAALVACQGYQIQTACNQYQLSVQNPEFYQQLINAGGACQSGDLNACQYLEQFRGIYF